MVITITTFDIGKTYSISSPCDHNCICTYTIIARTAQTITIEDGKQVKKCRISKQYSEYNKAETVFPLGQYSMCPILTAEKEI